MLYYLTFYDIFVNKVFSSLFFGLLVLMILPFSMTSADSVIGDEDGESVSTASVFPPLGQPIIDCKVDTGDIVGWDNSRGIIPSPFTTIISDLESNGFVVREVNISTQGIPDCIVKLVIVGFQGSAGCAGLLPYTGAEVSLIESYVNNGGALLVMSDHGTVPSGCGSHTHPVLAAFGITSVGPVGNPTFVSGTNFDPNNPSTLFQGVNSFIWGSGASYDTNDGVVATDDGIFPAGNPRVVAKTVQNGCIVATSDFNWIGSSVNNLDNRQLGLNVFTFLNECISKPVVGGEFLQIDSTALLLAAAQSPASWLTTLTIVALGIGAYVFTRNSNNMRNIKVILRDYLDRF